MSDTPTAPQPEYFAPHAKGVNYKNLLGAMSKILRPRTYLEIGTQMGASLALFDCHCIAIDPFFQPKQDVIGRKKSLLLFQMPSDDFFAQYDVTALLPEPKTLDFAFLDGMHHFEFLLRDFINAEKYCRPDSIVTMHDTFPIVPRAVGRQTFAGVRPKHKPNLTTRRPVHPTAGGWAGDVWKVEAILRKYRPDLKLMPVDAPPTGLSIVTNLDPKNTVLQQNYDQIIKDYMEADAAEGWFDTYYDAAKLTPSRPLLQAEELLKVFKPFQESQEAPAVTAA